MCEVQVKLWSLVSLPSKHLLLLHVWRPLFPPKIFLLSFVFFQYLHPTGFLKNISCAPTHSWWILWTFSCCIHTLGLAGTFSRSVHVWKQCWFPLVDVIAAEYVLYLSSWTASCASRLQMTTIPLIRFTHPLSAVGGRTPASGWIHFSLFLSVSAAELLPLLIKALSQNNAAHYHANPQASEERTHTQTHTQATV